MRPFADKCKAEARESVWRTLVDRLEAAAAKKEGRWLCAWLGVKLEEVFMSELRASHLDTDIHIAMARGFLQIEPSIVFDLVDYRLAERITEAFGAAIH